MRSLFLRPGSTGALLGLCGVVALAVITLGLPARAGEVESDLSARNKTIESHFLGLSVRDSTSCEYALYLVYAGHRRHQISLPGALSAP